MSTEESLAHRREGVDKNQTGHDPFSEMLQTFHSVNFEMSADRQPGQAETDQA